MSAETITPEQRAAAIIPPNYRAETAQTGVMPSMDMVLSSRCAGALRDAIASAIRAAETAAVEAERASGMRWVALDDMPSMPRGWYWAAFPDAWVWYDPGFKGALCVDQGSGRYQELMSKSYLGPWPEPQGPLRTPTTEADNAV